MYTDGEITIRPVRDEDMERLWELLYREENPEWKKVGRTVLHASYNAS